MNTAAKGFLVSLIGNPDYNKLSRADALANALNSYPHSRGSELISALNLQRQTVLPDTVDHDDPNAYFKIRWGEIPFVMGILVDYLAPTSLQLRQTKAFNPQLDQHGVAAAPDMEDLEARLNGLVIEQMVLNGLFDEMHALQQSFSPQTAAHHD